MKRYILLLAISLAFWSCKNQPGTIEVTKAFYYWKAKGIDDDVIAQLKKHQIHTLYVKLFEVDYSDVRGNFPFCKYKPNVYDFNKLDSLKVIPVIFIKNGIFMYNDEKSLDKLADNMAYLINKYSEDVDYSGHKTQVFNYDEIQIDCDWTASTKEKYFYLLEKIKELTHKNISCTLRLYPYKYPDKMGVPPVDKAILMCYNLIKPLSDQNKNSILDIAELKKYIQEKKSYPLHLDIALPTFYWTQLYQNNQFIQLVDLSTADVKSFAQSIKPMWYQVKQDTSINYELYLKAGDQLKCEDVSAQDLYQAIDVLKKNIALEPGTVISLFDLDRSTFTQYSHEEISAFYTRFSN